MFVRFIVLLQMFQCFNIHINTVVICFYTELLKHIITKCSATTTFQLIACLNSDILQCILQHHITDIYTSPSNRQQHQSNDVCPEAEREDYQNCSVL